MELIRVATTSRAAQIVVGRSTKAVHQLVGSIGGRLIASRDSRSLWWSRECLLGWGFASVSRAV